MLWDSTPSHVSRLRRGAVRPSQPTEDERSSGQSSMADHAMCLFAVADFKPERPPRAAKSCLVSLHRLDAEPDWEDNTGWSGTSKQVRTRKPFEP